MRADSAAAMSQSGPASRVGHIKSLPQLSYQIAAGVMFIADMI
jgi:hypothetical protein